MGKMGVSQCLTKERTTLLRCRNHRASEARRSLRALGALLTALSALSGERSNPRVIQDLMIFIPDSKPWEKACALSREVERLTGTVSSVFFLIGAELLFSFLLLTDWIAVTND